MHTPGPYLIYDDEHKNFVYALNEDGTNRISFSVQGGYVNQPKNSRECTRTPREEVQATAILLHAAPDLLEALELVKSHPNSMLHFDVWRKINAVIAKAKNLPAEWQDGN